MGQRLLWAGVGVAVLAALVVGGERLRWEGRHRAVELAVHAGDLRELLQRGEFPSLSAAWATLKVLGVRAWTVSPLDVRELREAIFPRRPGRAWLSLEELKRARETGLALYWRLDAWAAPLAFSRLLDALLALEPRGLLFVMPPSEPEALLRDSERLRALGVALAWDERSAPLPRALRLKALLERGVRRLVRAHVLKREERVALDVRAFAARYRRAVLERTVRLLELRALSRDQLAKDARTLTATLTRLGFALGPPASIEPFRPSGPGVWVLLWLGVLSALALAILRLFEPKSSGRVARRGLKPLMVMGGWALGVLGGGLALIAAPEAARPAAAWLTAVLTPILAFVPLQSRPPQTALEAFRAWAATSAIAALGGLVAAGFLSDEAHFLKLEAFRGVKAALALPVLIAAVLALNDPQTRAALRTRHGRGASGLVGAAVVGVLFVVLLRSGNVAEGGLLGGLWPPALLELERRVRDALDAWLLVRPRFKEFLVGQPALWLGLQLRRRLFNPRAQPWALGLQLIGLLAPVSIVNSFAHLHTPLGVTLLRTLHGVWLGLLLGLLGQTLLFRASRLFRTRPVD